MFPNHYWIGNPWWNDGVAKSEKGLKGEDHRLLPKKPQIQRREVGQIPKEKLKFVFLLNSSITMIYSIPKPLLFRNNESYQK